MSTAPRTFAFRYRDRPFELRVTEDGTFELYLDGVLRKDRPATGVEPQYLWTNIELQWEEHHYIEARFWASSRQLTVTSNRQPLHEAVL